MRAAIIEISSALQTLGKGLAVGRCHQSKRRVLGAALRYVFPKRLSLPNLMRKKSFYELAEHVPQAEIDPEIGEKLDAIVQVAGSASPGVSDF